MADEIVKENQAGKMLPWNPEELENRLGAASKPLTQKVMGKPGIFESWTSGAKSVASDIERATAPIVPFEKTVPTRPYGVPEGLPTPFGQPISGNVPEYRGVRPWSKTGPTSEEAGEIVPESKPTAGLTGGTTPVTTTPIRTHVNEQGVIMPGETSVSEGPTKPGVSSFDKGAGYTPGGSEVVPTGGGYGGFVDSEMKRIEKDRAEYDKYLRDKEDKELLGLGPEGEQRIKKRMEALSPYLEGVSKGRKARVFAGVLEQSMKEESEARRAMYTTKASGEAATTAAAIRAGATREAAYTKAQTEAAKLGIDIRKLGIEEQKLGIEAGKASSTIRESMAKIQNMMHGQQMEEMKVALGAAKDATERKKIEMDFAQKAITTSYTEGLKNLREEFRMNPNAKEFQERAQALYNDYAQHFQVLDILNPKEGKVAGNNIYKGGKWVPLSEEDKARMNQPQQQVVPE